ncbi:hypothetical protein BDV96DRAFT_648014 [Lophiotrema nucula]|uniref:Uncharacterized protein n=1 Tax=Lophiotrema nucula TaxID=690887 RepID=A0A6A5Z2S6_9PLEO|nr:hypothetical protein BDV96DRAFT_648014 [Lophiotrema nucula]
MPVPVEALNSLLPDVQNALLRKLEVRDLEFMPFEQSWRHDAMMWLAREPSEPSQPLIEDRRRSPSPGNQELVRVSTGRPLPPGSIPTSFDPYAREGGAKDSTKDLIRESDSEDDNYKTKVRRRPKDSEDDSDDDLKAEATSKKSYKESKQDLIRESDSDDDDYKTVVKSKKSSKQKKEKK